MFSKQMFAVVFLVSAVCFAGFAQPKGTVVVLQAEVQNISGNAELPNYIKNFIEENIQKYTSFATVVDEAAERKVKEQQRRSESAAHSESDSIEIGKLMNAQYAIFPSVRKAGNAYTLNIRFTDLTTGVHRATITSRQYGRLEELYSHPGAVDEVTLELCGRLGIELSPTQKLVLQHGESDLSVEQQLEMERKEEERFQQQMKELDTQIAVLNRSVQADAETQRKKLEAQKALSEQKLKAAQERIQRRYEEQEKRLADMKAEANREESSIARRNKMSEELSRKTKSVRAASAQNLNIMGRIELLETKKKTFNEMQEELAKHKEEIEQDTESEFEKKKAEIESRPWRAAELAGGKPTEEAKKRRKNEIAAQLDKLRAQADKEKAAVEKEVHVSSDPLLEEIIGEYTYLEKTVVTISSIKNEKDIQYSVGTFNGDTNSWSVLLYFYNNGKESLGQYKASVSYQALTGKKTFSERKENFRSREQEESAYNEFLDDVDLYNSLFAHSAQVLTFEVDYVVEPWSVPSQYRICFKELRIKDTLDGKLLHSEKIVGLEKIVSFPEYHIQAEHYVRIVSPTSKNIPSYLLYEFALAAQKNGDNAETSRLMRRATEKKYTPALNYFAQKEANELEQQRATAQAKAEEEGRKWQEREIEKLWKKAQNDELYHARRLGFALSGDFSPAVQNFAFEIKYFSDSYYNPLKLLLVAMLPPLAGFSGFYLGGGVNTWLRDEDWDALCAYFLFGFSVPLKRIRPYIECGGGIGGVKMSEDANVGFYGYVKGGVELRISPHLSIDGFCKPQGYTGEKSSESYYVGALSGGISIVFWKLF